MDQIKIEDVTVEKLVAGEYRETLPEFYQLKSVVENSPWHVNQSVFDHVVKVYEELEKLLAKFKLSSERAKLLKVATLLHDIAKPDTVITEESGVRCPGHELLGAVRVKNFSKRFGLNDTELKTVEKIVRHHGFMSEILNYILRDGDLVKWDRVFREVTGEVALELILLMQAYLAGSDLAKNQPLEFERRKDLLDRMKAREIVQGSL